MTAVSFRYIPATIEKRSPLILAFSRDAGRTFSQPIRLDDGASLGRVDVEMLPDGSALATWIEFADGRSFVRAASRQTVRAPRQSPSQA